MTQTLSPAPRITNDGSATPCPSCNAYRLFPSTGLWGEEMEEWVAGMDAELRNFLHCRSCGYDDRGLEGTAQPLPERQAGYRSKVE